MEKNFFDSPAGYRVQKTLKAPVSFSGVGLHCGKRTRVELSPAPANHGIILLRTDLAGAKPILAHFNAVVCTKLATTIGFKEHPDSNLMTVEHILAALYAMGVNNVLVKVDGPEIPIMDGSAGPFLEGILDTGIELQPYSAPVLKILKPIKVYEKGAICELLPRDQLRLTTSIDFAHPSVGPQTYALEVTPRNFQREVSSSRTFGFLKDQQLLQSMNLALGASLENVLAFSDEGILNPEGQRHEDECVRHKLLDSLGDLALCGSWIEGEMLSFRGGHSMHLALLKALETHPTHWSLSRAEPLAQFSYSAERYQPTRPLPITEIIEA